MTRPPVVTGPVERAPAPDELRRLGIRLATGFLAAVALVLVFGVIADDVRDKERLFIDTAANPVLHSLQSPTLDWIMNTATLVGSAPVVVPVFGLALLGLLAARRWRLALFMIVAAGGSLALNQGMKAIFQRPRPQLPWAHVIPEYSFPSGHSMNGLVVYVGLALVLWALVGRRVGIPAVVASVILVALIGTSRIYLGYHYFTDVVGGYAAGLAWLLIVAIGFEAGPFLRSWRAAADARRAAAEAATSPPGA